MDQTGAAVPNSEVTAVGPHNEESLTFLSGAKGDLVLSVPRHAFRLRVIAAGFLPEFVPVPDIMDVLRSPHDLQLAAVLRIGGGSCVATPPLFDACSGLKKGTSPALTKNRAVTLIVQNAEGLKARDAEIRRRSADDIEQVAGLTDSAGMLSFVLPQSNQNLCVQGSWFLQQNLQSANLVPGKVLSLVVQLNPAILGIRADRYIPISDREFLLEPPCKD